MMWSRDPVNSAWIHQQVQTNNKTTLAADKASPSPTLQEVQEPSGIIAFKFILGVALLPILSACMLESSTSAQFVEVC